MNPRRLPNEWTPPPPGSAAEALVQKIQELVNSPAAEDRPKLKQLGERLLALRQQ